MLPLVVEDFMWEKLVVDHNPQLTEPALLVSVSTSLPQYRALYSQGRELARQLLRKMEFRQLASMYASALPPAVLINEGGTSRLVSDNFYYHKGERDIILLAGDSSPTDEQYEFSRSVLSFAKRLGVRDVFSIGARWTESAISPLEVPKVLGFGSDRSAVEELKAQGVTIMKDEPAPFFASLVVGLAELYEMRGFKISVNHGEPIPHPKTLIAMLGVLGKMLKFQVEVSDLEKQAGELPGVLASLNQDAASVPPQKSDIYQ